MEDNPYEPPQAPIKLTPAEVFLEASQLRDKLINEQSFLRVFIVAFLGSIVGVIVLAAFLIAPGIFFLAFAMPGTLTGFVLRQFGKALDRKYRIFGAVVSLLSYWLFIELISPSSSTIAFVLSFLNAIVAGYISRRSLTVDEESAIYLRRMRVE